MSEENWIIKAIIRRLPRIIYEIYSGGMHYPYNSNIGQIYDELDDKIIFYERRALDSIKLTKKRLYEEEGYG
jgi:hypothetical protein